MSSYSTNEFKSGLKILIDGDPYSIVENEMVKPGKGQAFNRVKVRNLKNGKVVERTWKSGDTVEAADVVDADMQYLYAEAISGPSCCPTPSSSTPPARRRWAMPRSGSRTASSAS